MATGLSDKFHKNPEYYSRLAKNLETALNIILSGTIEILSCITPNKKILYIFRNFMVYLGKHTMPVFLFKGGLAALSGDKLQFDIHRYFAKTTFRVYLPWPDCNFGLKYDQVESLGIGNILQPTCPFRAVSGRHSEFKKVIFVGLHARRGDRIKKWKARKMFKLVDWIDVGLLLAKPGTQLWAPMRGSSSIEQWRFSGKYYEQEW